MDLLDFVGKYAGLFVTTVLGGGVGAFLSSYLKRKGENLATHEDIRKLVDQVSAVTQATKEIEAKISNEMWDRQRRWDTKREALFEAAKNLGSLQNALTTLHSAGIGAKLSADPKSLAAMTTKNEAAEAFSIAHVNFYNAKALALLVCGAEVKHHFNQLDALVLSIANDIFDIESTVFIRLMLEVTNKSNDLALAIRRELKIDE